MDRRAGAESGSHRESRLSIRRPRARPRHCPARERQCREPRRLVQVAHKPVQHLDFERSETSPPSKPRRRSARLSGRLRARRARPKESGLARRGRPLTRARSAARLTASVAPTPAATISISPSKPEILAPACGASHTMRRLTSAPSGLAGGANSRSFRAARFPSGRRRPAARRRRARALRRASSA